MLVRANSILRTEPSMAVTPAPLPGSAPANAYHGYSGKFDIGHIVDSLVAKNLPADVRPAEKTPSCSSSLSISKLIVEEPEETGSSRDNTVDQQQPIEQVAQEDDSPLIPETEPELGPEPEPSQYCSVPQEVPTQVLPCKASTSVPNDKNDTTSSSSEQARKKRRVNVTKLKRALKTGSIRVRAQFAD